MKTTVVNIHVTEEFDVLITRPGKWGNPFVIGRDGDRDQVIALYEAWLTDDDDDLAAMLRSSLHELKGLRLGCVCKPRPCHGDVLARLADGLAG